MAGSLAGRTALVTGALGGLGRAHSAALAGAGARVVMLDHKPDGEDEVARFAATLPGHALAPQHLHCDLADNRHAKAAVQALSERMGGIDILINNAAINPLKALDAYDLEEYGRVQAINAGAAVALSQAVVPAMKAKRYGQIVQICSITLNGGWSDFTAYVASKGTLLGLTRAMARELGAWDIRVNAISPGAIPTPLEGEVWGDRIDSYEKSLLEHQALKFRGSPEDVAEAMLFLVSDRARFITGQNLTVDGGWWMQ